MVKSRSDHRQSPPITSNHPPITSKICVQSPSNHLWNTTWNVMTWCRNSGKLFLCSLMMRPLANLAIHVCWLSFIALPSSLSLLAPSLFPHRFQVCSVFSLCLRFSLIYFFHRWSVDKLAGLLAIKMGPNRRCHLRCRLKTLHTT